MYSPISFYIQVYEACDDFEPVVERLNGFLEQVLCPEIFSRFLSTGFKFDLVSKMASRYFI